MAVLFQLVSTAQPTTIVCICLMEPDSEAQAKTKYCAEFLRYKHAVVGRYFTDSKDLGGQGFLADQKLATASGAVARASKKPMLEKALTTPQMPEDLAKYLPEA